MPTHVTDKQLSVVLRDGNVSLSPLQGHVLKEYLAFWERGGRSFLLSSLPVSFLPCDLLVQLLLLGGGCCYCERMSLTFHLEGSDIMEEP